MSKDKKQGKAGGAGNVSNRTRHTVNGAVADMKPAKAAKERIPFIELWRQAGGTGEYPCVKVSLYTCTALCGIGKADSGAFVVVLQSTVGNRLTPQTSARAFTTMEKAESMMDELLSLFVQSVEKEAKKSNLPHEKVVMEGAEFILPEDLRKM